jgi:hypothetical protein
LSVPRARSKSICLTFFCTAILSPTDLSYFKEAFKVSNCFLLAGRSSSISIWVCSGLLAIWRASRQINRAKTCWN